MTVANTFTFKIVHIVDIYSYRVYIEYKLNYLAYKNDPKTYMYIYIYI